MKLRNSLLLALGLLLSLTIGIVLLLKNEQHLPLFNLSGQRPADLGVQDGKLQECPDKPNCVCSQSDKAYSQIQPLPIPKEGLSDLKKIIHSMQRTQIIQEEENYLYAEFTSALMGYVDDVEFYLQSEEGVIHVKSASRLGNSDFGQNRKRIEAIREALSQL